MRTVARTVLIALLAPAAVAADVQVRVNGARVDVVAKAAPLQEVLARLSQQTGMKVVYDGTPPRAFVTVSLPQRTPVEAVLALFEGLGLNYALSTDRSGTRVEMLIVSSPNPGGASPIRTGGPAPTMPTPDPRRPPQRSQPLPDDERDEEQQADEDPARPQPTPAPTGPVIFPGAIPGPRQPGSPFGGQIGPLTLPTPPPAVVPTPAPSPTPSPTGS